LGIVLRQSLKYTIISALGSLIGAFSVLFVYPLSLESYGFSQALANYGLFLVPFIGFGSSNLIIKYYQPQSAQPNQVLAWGLLMGLCNILVFVILYLLLVKPHTDALHFIGFDSTFFEENAFFLISIGILMVLIGIFINHSNNLKRAVVPNLLYNVGLKIFTPFLIYSIYAGFIESKNIPLVFLFFYSATFIFLAFYVKKLGGWPSNSSKTDWSVFKKGSFYKYSLVSGLTGVAGILATKIDIISIAGMANLEEVGKYSLPYFMAGLIEIPLGGMAAISGPLIAQHLKNNETSALNQLLKKASNTLFLSGSIIFVFLYAIFYDLTSLSNRPLAFKDGLAIFFIIGLAKIFDMATSLNTQTISYSKYYTYNLYLVIITAISNLFFTFFLTKKYGIVGTSLSILISVVIFNSLKFGVLILKMGINAFSLSTIKIAFLFCMQLLLAQGLTFSFSPLVNIALKTSLLAISFMGLIWLLKPSEDIDTLIFGADGILKSGLSIKKIKRIFGL
jgi:O-antigen/teichoic acid export membrane protein